MKEKALLIKEYALNVGSHLSVEATRSFAVICVEQITTIKKEIERKVSF